MHFFGHLGGLFGLGQRSEKPLFGSKHPPNAFSVTKKVHTRTMSDSCMHFFGHLGGEGYHFCLGQRGEKAPLGQSRMCLNLSFSNAF